MKSTAKRRYDLFPVHCLAWIVDALTLGADKHGPDSYRNQPDARAVYYSAAMRHVEAWRAGNWTDPERGIPHLAHAAANVVLLLAMGPADLPTGAVTLGPSFEHGQDVEAAKQAWLEAERAGPIEKARAALEKYRQAQGLPPVEILAPVSRETEKGLGPEKDP